MVSDAVLQRPLAWRDPGLIPMLAQLQGNILKGHGRDHTRNLFLRFGGEPARARRALADLAHGVTSAIEQLSAVVRFRADGTGGGPVCFLFLSAAGYRALGADEAAMPADPAFREGMRARAARLGDPDPAGWDASFGTPPHGLLLVGADSADEVDHEAERLVTALAAGGIEVVAVERGAALRKGPKGLGFDHLGQIDGRSQPLMLTDDMAGAGAADGGIFGWDPAFGPGQLAIVRDPGNANDDAFGSYLVFRKLEQDVAAFDRAARGLAQNLGKGEAPGGAGSLAWQRDDTALSGRQPVSVRYVANGFPVADVRYDSGRLSPVLSSYADARADSMRHFHADPVADRSRLMPRRAIPYGDRAPDLSDRPSAGVGLLFMTYNQDIERQFEYMQGCWKSGAGCACGDASHLAPVPGNDTGSAAPSPSAFVRMRGGEYFFAPSIGFLTALSDGLGPR